MLAEMIQKIAELVNAGHRPQVIDLPNATEYLLADKNGHTVMTKEAKPRNHYAYTLQSFLHAVKHYGAPVVWIDNQSAIALLEDDYRRQRVILEFGKSQELQALEKLASSTDQKQLILALRRDLCGAVDTGLLATVRKLEFKRNTGGQGDRQHGRESLGRQVEASVTGTGDLPEVLPVTIPLVSNADLRTPYRISCIIDIDVDAERFRILPRAGEVDAAWDDFIQATMQIMAQECPATEIFFGMP